MANKSMHTDRRQAFQFPRSGIFGRWFRRQCPSPAAAGDLWTLGGITRMAYFFKLRDFEKRFDTMDVEELKRWRVYWTRHAKGLAPKIRKIAMKRVDEVERAIELKSRGERH